MTGQESKMELQIDYLKNNEQVYIENKASGNVTESVTLNEKIEKNNNSNVKDNAVLKDTESKQEDIKRI